MPKKTVYWTCGFKKKSRMFVSAREADIYAINLLNRGYKDVAVR